MVDKIKFLWQTKPLTVILFCALLTRLVAAIFSQGYGMHDDHFLVIEASQSWVDGYDYNNWLPWNQINPKPEGHSFFYVGLHFLFFSFMKMIGVTNPTFKMLLVRLIHALISLSVVYYGYRITEKMAGEKQAKWVGLLLAISWFMPFLSVRNLMEMFCIPFLIIGVWKVLIADNQKNKYLHYFLAGLIVGIAFSIRFQTIVFIGGIGLVVLFQKKWLETFLLALGVLISIVAIQGVVDIFIWKRPFAELTEYVIYNWTHKRDYGTDVWYMYISILAGIFVSPLSFMFLFGFFRTWKKYALLFVPTLCFIIFHNMFPNKQERFIFTMIPFFIILGYIGWSEFAEKSEYWKRKAKFHRGCFIFFWVINTLLLLAVTPAFSKRSRVETMTYLSKYKDQIHCFLTEDTNRTDVNMFPFYYMGKWNANQYILAQREDIEKNLSDTVYRVKSKYVRKIFSIDYYQHAQKSEIPQFVLFIDRKNLEHRVKELQKIFPKLHLETVIEPSFLDNLLYKMNPVNKNMPIYIYKVE